MLLIVCHVIRAGNLLHAKEKHALCCLYHRGLASWVWQCASLFCCCLVTEQKAGGGCWKSKWNLKMTSFWSSSNSYQMQQIAQMLSVRRRIHVLRVLETMNSRRIAKRAADYGDNKQHVLNQRQKTIISDPPAHLLQFNLDSKLE